MRLVPMTDTNYEWCLEHQRGYETPERLARAYEAAPPDPVAVIAAWFEDHFTGLDEYDRAHVEDMALSMFSQLGMP